MKQTTSKGNFKPSREDHLAQRVWSHAREVEMTHQTFLDFLNTQPSFQTVEDVMGFHFSKRELLFEALTHSSFVNEFAKLDVRSYERLEFLGDALVDFFVSKELSRRYSDLSEGELSRLRAALVNEHSLSELSWRHSLGEGLLLGKAEILSQGWTKDSILADIIESLMAAVYLDQGIDQAEKAFHTILKGSEDYFSLSKLDEFDAKSRLQEKTMALYKALPEYRATELSDGSYKVELFLCSLFIASVEAPSKKKGEMKVAARALKENLYVLKE